jgi:dihydrodipicolinate synthase/N-acetylneuraminate lyase
MSAILLPFTAAGDVDWVGFAAHVERTAAAGLTPAVNMDTGYVQLLDPPTRDRVLDVTRSAVGGAFVAGAFVADTAGDAFDAGAYARELTRVAEHGGLPVVFPSHGLNALDEDGWVDAHRGFGERVDRFLGFELGPMFVPYGRIVSLSAYEALLGIPQCVGAKHSSLRRRPEWDRLALRDRVRPDFLVLTGNDLAIDMVMYGSDYLLGLSTFAPDLFARRDRMWADGDAAFYELNDALQYLGFLTFRAPVPGYRHDAAMWLQLRGWIDHDGIPDGAQQRPAADREILAELADRLGVRA